MADVISSFTKLKKLLSSLFNDKANMTVHTHAEDRKSSSNRKPGGNIARTAIADEEDTVPPSTSLTAPRRRAAAKGEKKQFVVPIIMNVAILVICIAVAVLGSKGAMKVATNSRFQWLAGWSIGFAVQAALVPIINLSRMLCQLLFAHGLIKRGMRGRDMVAAWSALYSGSFRGLEDITSGASLIALVLLSMYLGEVVVIGAIGNLYYPVATRAIRVEGTMPLMRVLGGSGEVDTNHLADRLVAELPRLSGALYKQGVLFPSQPVSKSCNSSLGSCDVSRFSVSHPYGTSFYDPSNRVDCCGEVPSMELDEEIVAKMTALRADVSCKAAVNATSWRPYPTYTIWQVWELEETVSLQSGRQLEENPIPEVAELSISPLLLDLNADTDIYVDNDGGRYVFLFARNFNQTIPGFYYVDDPVNATRSQIGVSICRIGVYGGLADAVISLAYMDPAIISRVQSASVIENSFEKHSLLLEDMNDASPAASAMLGPLQKLTCWSWMCPSTPGSIPWFMSVLGIMPALPVTQSDYDNILGTAAAALADIFLVQLSGMSAVMNGTSTSYQIATEQSHSIL